LAGAFFAGAFRFAGAFFAGAFRLAGAFFAGAFFFFTAFRVLKESSSDSFRWDRVECAAPSALSGTNPGRARSMPRRGVSIEMTTQESVSPSDTTSLGLVGAGSPISLSER